MAQNTDFPAVMYGPPERFFEPKLAAEEQLRRIYVVAAVFIDQASASAQPCSEAQTKILACQRGYGKWEGWWEFPGGKIKPGETDQHALHREIKEELDCEIEIISYYDTIDYRYDDFLMTLHLYFCRMVGGPDAYTLKEHADARWLTQDQLSSVRWLPADLELIARWQRQMPSIP